MEAEIGQQADLLATHSDGYERQLRSMIGGRKFDMALLAARGSSDNAALYLRYLIEIHLQIPVSLAAPSVLTRYGSHVRYPNCLAIGISQSGAAPDVSEVLGEMRAQGHTTLAITNTPGSRLTEEAEFALHLDAGEEIAVAATKTYTCSLLAAYQLVRALGGLLPDPRPCLPDNAWIERCREGAEMNLGPIVRFPTLFALARGYSFSSAQETALKLMECALLPCKSYSTADFEHGPKALAQFGTAAIVYGAVPTSLGDSECALVVPDPAPDGPLSPLWEVIFGQFIALMAARARGLDPDKPQNLSKVTKTL